MGGKRTLFRISSTLPAWFCAASLEPRREVTGAAHGAPGVLLASLHVAREAHSVEAMPARRLWQAEGTQEHRVVLNTGPY